VASWIILNKITLGAQAGGAAVKFFPGQVINDAIQATSPLVAAGAILWPMSDPVMSAAQALVQALKLRGQLTDAEASAQLHSAALFSMGGGVGGGLLGPTPASGVSPFGLVGLRSATIGFAQFAAAVTNTFNIGAILPANSRILKRELRIATEFTGGGLSSMTLSVGIAARTTDIVNAQDVYGTSGNIDGAAGTDTGALYATASQLIATFTGSAADAPTAGSVVIDVLYAAGLSSV